MTWDKYSKRTGIVDAVLLTEFNIDAVAEDVGGNKVEILNPPQAPVPVLLVTDQRGFVFRVPLGFWFVKSDGEFEIISPEIFSKIYEKMFIIDIEVIPSIKSGELYLEESDNQIRIEWDNV